MHSTDQDAPSGTPYLAPPASGLEHFWKILVLAGLYALAGAIGVLLNQSSGYASPIWPAAGVSIAVLLTWGSRCWPGVFLGDLLIDLALEPSLTTIGLASFTAAAATLQSLLGARLARRYLLDRWQIANDRELASLLIAVGPLACLIAPTLGCAVLLAGGKLASAELFNEWLRWWAGDTLGVLLFAPLTLLLWPGSPALRLGEGSYRFALPLLLTAILLGFGHIAMSQLEEPRTRAEVRMPTEALGEGHLQGSADTPQVQLQAPLWRPGAMAAQERLFLGFSVLAALLASFAILSSSRRHALFSREVAEHSAQLLRELDARNRALADLHAKEQEIRAVLDHQLECVITIDSRGMVQSVNPAVEPLLGYRPDELVGHNISCIMASPLREQHDEHIARYMRTGEKHIIGFGREVSALHKDGHPVDVELSVSEYSVHGQRFFIGSLRDIREHKALIASLTQAREEAEQANRAKSAFLATMSHEIRTPMNGVVGLIEVLAHDRLLPRQAELIGTIRESSSNLLGVVDDILDFSKIEAGRLEIDHAPLQLVELIENLCDTLRPMAEARGVGLEREIAAEVPAWVSSDATRLRQILYNLIGNAIKFSGGRPEQPGRVVVRASLAGGDAPRLVIAVEDNGIGIAAEHLNQLFSPFNQAESSTTRRFGGSGLGLAICQRLVALLAGDIDVSSTQGRGSCFTVTLPLTLASAQPPLAAPLALPAPQVAPDSRRILVVEDDRVNRKVIQQQLALLGYDFQMARHGAEALDMWRRGGYDLILSDLHMPEMDGYRLARLIRDAEAEAGQVQRTPILALTANAMRDEAARVRKAGMDEYLTKPIRLATLQAALERWLPPQAAGTSRQPGAETMQDGARLVDPAALAALVGTDREMIREILADYAESLRSLAAGLQQAFARNDGDAIDALAHRLKSSSRAVGAVALGLLCAALEQAIKDGDSTALAGCIAEFPSLHEATKARIDQLLNEDNLV